MTFAYDLAVQLNGQLMLGLGKSRLEQMVAMIEEHDERIRREERREKASSALEHFEKIGAGSAKTGAEATLAHLAGAPGVYPVKG